tara:strand:+ start:1737 stop:3731 length:1995 start_codon:yes stop_codon:yes gene_type:complete
MNKHHLLTILLLTLALTSLSSAQEDYLTTEKVNLDISLSSNITLIPSSSDYKIDYIQADLSFFPREDDRQKIITINIAPEAPEINNSLRFKWENLFNNLAFSVNSNLETTNKVSTIPKKLEFPIKSIPEKIIPYTLPSSNIDSDNPNIILLSSSLVEGEDDLYIVVDILANWVKDNIVYSLDTLTAEVSQKASWVLNEKEGVCDEITTLFIALSRSLGIPARYISGMAYTNWKGINDFGPHAWAEVYFPGYGWIPFDITYNQMGFIDPSHIKLKESLDSDEPSTEYEWKGVNIDIETNNLDIKTESLKKTGKLEPLILIEVKALKTSVGYDSYNLIEAEITNLKNYYLSPELSLSKTKEIAILGKSRKNIVLKPNQKKKIYWVLHLTKNLDPRFSYTFPIQVYSSRNTSSQISFTSSLKDQVFGYTEINNLKEDLEEETSKKYSKKLSLNCTLEKDEFYTYETPEVNCKIENQGNVLLTDLEACLEEDCEKIDIGITHTKSLNYNLNMPTPGKKEIKFMVKNTQVSKSIFLKLTVLDEPRIIINNLELPTSVSFDQKFSFDFELEKHSLSNPRNVEVRLVKDSLIKNWNINELLNDQKFIIDMEGNMLKLGENTFRLLVKYKDKNNKSYNQTSEFSTSLDNVTPIQKIQIYLNQFIQEINSWFT